MRKVNKIRMLLATLLVLAMLCSFPVISAEAMNAEKPAEEMSAETILVPEETAGSETEPAPETESETAFEAEPAVEPETEPEAEPASEPEGAAEAEPAAAPEATEAPADMPEEEMKPETAEEPAQENAEEELEEEMEEEPAEAQEDNLCEIDDDDAGYISDELLEMYNHLAANEKAAFTGNVNIELKDSEIAFGQDVTLVAKVSGAETLNYCMIWEANDGDERGWYTIGTGDEYTFLLTRANAGREYRVVLFSVD